MVVYESQVNGRCERSAAIWPESTLINHIDCRASLAMTDFYRTIKHNFDLPDFYAEPFYFFYFEVTSYSEIPRPMAKASSPASRVRAN